MALQESPLPFWSRVKQLESEADGRNLDHRAWVADERFDALLARDTQDDITPEELAACERRKQNRAKKHFARERIHRELAAAHTVRDPFAEVDNCDEVEAALQLILAEDAALLVRVANGESYEGISQGQGVAPGTLKARASRAREAIRQQRA
jgi:DNA-directed RNA polymerase specialized sigma24 family protein